MEEKINQKPIKMWNGQASIYQLLWVIHVTWDSTCQIYIYIYEIFNFFLPILPEITIFKRKKWFLCKIKKERDFFFMHLTFMSRRLKFVVRQKCLKLKKKERKICAMRYCNCLQNFIVSENCGNLEARKKARLFEIEKEILQLAHLTNQLLCVDRLSKVHAFCSRKQKKIEIFSHFTFESIKHRFEIASISFRVRWSEMRKTEFLVFFSTENINWEKEIFSIIGHWHIQCTHFAIFSSLHRSLSLRYQTIGSMIGHFFAIVRTYSKLILSGEWFYLVS